MNRQVKMSSYLRTLDGQEHHIREIRSTKCFCCGICCTRYQPQLAPEEVETIAEELRLTNEDFLARYAQFTNIGYLLRQSEKGCIFLSWEKGETRAICSIYPLRPEACRHWVADLSRPECREGLTSLDH